MARKNEDKQRGQTRLDGPDGPGTAANRPRSGGAPGPTKLRRSDDVLAGELYEILTKDPELDATEIEVQVQGGAVTLIGVVESPDAKLLAEELVESVVGVREVHNYLKVTR